GSCAGRVAALADEDPARAIVRRVERNLDLDAAARAEHVDALVRRLLRTAGADRVRTAKIEHHRHEPVDAEPRIHFDGRDYARGLAIEDPSRGVNQVTADVE